VAPWTAEPCPELQEDGFAYWPETTEEKADVVGTCKPGYQSKSGTNPVRLCSLTGSGGNAMGWNPIVLETECIRTAGGAHISSWLAARCGITLIGCLVMRGGRIVAHRRERLRRAQRPESAQVPRNARGYQQRGGHVPRGHQWPASQGLQLADRVV